MQFFLEGQQSYASLLGSFLNVDGWKTAAGPLVQMHRLLRRICCGGVRQHHLGVKKTASIVSTIPHLHQLQFQFSHVFIFQLGLNCAVANFSWCRWMRSVRIYLILRFVLALAFCDLALLLRPSLLYQRSVKRRYLRCHSFEKRWKPYFSNQKFVKSHK